MAEWVQKGSLMGPQGPKGDTGETGPKGDAGETGPKGETGATGATPVISMTATVDQTTGTPNVSVSKSGSDEAPSFNLAITGIKGEKGDKGDTGDQGPQGEIGPQGPKGADATFPEGGTDGQVLTKTDDGEAWEDVPQPDMTGVVKTDSSGKIISGGSNTAFSVESGSNYAKFGSSSGGALNLYTQSGQSRVYINSSDGNFIDMTADYDYGARIKTNGSLVIGSKSVSSITDSISASPAGNSLATDKAVADYVAANAGGGGLELLWEGTANKLTSTNIGVDLTEYSLVVFETTESSSNYSAVYPVVCPNPRVGSSYYTSHISGRYMSIDIANVSTVVLSYSYIAYLRAVYGIKASGGGA